jgi:hypothetical protein
MRITLDIQEDKLAFFLELIRNFNFVQLHESDKLALSDHLLDMAEERLASYESNADDVLTWDEVRKSGSTIL